MYTNEFAKLWFKLSKELRIHMDTQLSPTLTESQLNVLEYVLAHDRMKPSDLIHYLATTPAAVTTLLDRMEKNELIERVRDERDRRIVWIHVTHKGREECKRGVDIRETFLTEYLSRISSHNQQLLVYLLGKITNVEQQRISS
ncbi:MarR family winged helix-turn-helix transcriptional regulator [Paenibacillus thermotolerans]|uniref:MarR family winged helix-turn-helix transcriptional regulator n=1 Tax=Paenibacillus thermotolerans TaxID=3027807 RepID=UPI0023683E49|nr:MULTISPECIES: MarR family transcriptional regulator [unclassified Paenibacillus]